MRLDTDPVIAAQTSQTRGTQQGHEKKRRSNSQILKREAWRRGWDSNPRMEVLQTSPLGHLGTAPFLITQLLTATALPSTLDLLPNLLQNSDQVFPSPEFQKCRDTASAACRSAPRDR